MAGAKLENTGINLYYKKHICWTPQALVKTEPSIKKKQDFFSQDRKSPACIKDLLLLFRFDCRPRVWCLSASSSASSAQTQSDLTEISINVTQPGSLNKPHCAALEQNLVYVSKNRFGKDHVIQIWWRLREGQMPGGGGRWKVEERKTLQFIPDMSIFRSAQAINRIRFGNLWFHDGLVLLLCLHANFPSKRILQQVNF